MMLVPMPRPRPSPRSSRGGKGQGPVLPSEARTGGLEAEEGELRAKFAIKDAAMLFSCRKRRGFGVGGRISAKVANQNNTKTNTLMKLNAN